MSYSRMPAEFVGQSTDTLQQWLSDAQLALQALSTGQKAVTLAYNAGAGAKSVTYQMTDVGMLQRRIDDLANALGLTCRRRPIRVGF